jgi:cation transport ATPase
LISCVPPEVAVSQAIRMAASVEQYSRHPLARAILQRAREETITLAPAVEIRRKAGRGLARQSRRHIDPDHRPEAITASKFSPCGVLAATRSGMECILLIGGRYGATFHFRDAPRVESQAFVRHLIPKHRGQLPSAGCRSYHAGGSGPCGSAQCIAGSITR